LTLERLKEAIDTFQVGTCEFQFLQGIRDNLSLDQTSVNPESIELELWKETVFLLPIQGVQSILDFLVKENIRVAAISNAIFSSPFMAYELEKHGLNGHFEFILSSADLGIRGFGDRCGNGMWV
jgi:FMN phosphatase YigB (HAD superfamily)